jgi:predicted DNA-binding transcriptional regulator
MEARGRGRGRRSSKGTGIALLVASIGAFIVYAYFLLASQWSIIVLQLTVLAAVAALVAVLAWIGYTIATAQTPDAATGSGNNNNTTSNNSNAKL